MILGPSPCPLQPLILVHLKKAIEFKQRLPAIESNLAKNRHQLKGGHLKGIEIIESAQQHDLSKQSNSLALPAAPELTGDVLLLHQITKLKIPSLKAIIEEYQKGTKHAKLKLTSINKKPKDGDNGLNLENVAFEIAQGNATAKTAIVNGFVAEADVAIVGGGGS